MRVSIEASLKRTVAALREAHVPFLLGGSLAVWARGGRVFTSDGRLVASAVQEGLIRPVTR